VKANKAMESLLADLPHVVLEGELGRIARSGFVERDGCIFIEALNPQSHMSLDSFLIEPAMSVSSTRFILMIMSVLIFSYRYFLVVPGT